MKKRMFIVMVSVLVVLALGVALAQEYQYPKETTGFQFTAKKIKEPPYVVGFSNFSVLNSWRVQMVEEFNQEVERNKSLIKEVYITNANDNIAKQIADIEDLIAKGVDILLVTAISPTALIPVVEKAYKQGIVVVDFDNLVYTDNITAHVIVDQESFGRVGAEWLVEQLGGKGNIIILNGVSGTSINAERENGAMSVFEKYPDIKILGKAYAHWDYAEGKKATENFLAAHPQIDGVWSQGGAMTQGAIEAFVEAGRPLIPMTGEDNNGFLKLWKKYRAQGFKGISTSMPTYCSAVALDVALAAIQGLPYYKYTVIPIPTITDEDLDKYVREDLPDSFWANTRLSDETIKKIFAR
jgi:ribose transport system substrate-binding protein